MPRRAPLFYVILTAALVVAALSFRKTAAQAPAPPVAPTAAWMPNELIDQIMVLVGRSRVDDAVELMEGLRNNPEEKQAARNALLELRQQQGECYGYEIASTQRFTSQYMAINIIGNYEHQPVLFRFRFYHPQANPDSKWVVLTFHTHSAHEEMGEQLKDTPIDYSPHHPTLTP